MTEEVVKPTKVYQKYPNKNKELHWVISKRVDDLETEEQKEYLRQYRIWVNSRIASKEGYYETKKIIAQKCYQRHCDDRKQRSRDYYTRNRDLVLAKVKEYQKNRAVSCA